MPADLKAPFKESCCDGGECNVNDNSCQPCGCDTGMRRNGKVVGYLCQFHREEAELVNRLAFPKGEVVKTDEGFEIKRDQ